MYIDIIYKHIYPPRPLGLMACRSFFRNPNPQSLGRGLPLPLPHFGCSPLLAPPLGHAKRPPKRPQKPAKRPPKARQRPPRGPKNPPRGLPKRPKDPQEAKRDPGFFSLFQLDPFLDPRKYLRHCILRYKTHVGQNPFLRPGLLALAIRRTGGVRPASKGKSPHRYGSASCSHVGTPQGPFEAILAPSWVILGPS